MKNSTLSLLAAGLLGLAASNANAQGTRNSVVLEVFTGTWCTYCPGSAMGTDDLIHNGKMVAPVKYHIGDNHEIPDGAARDTYYAVTGYPTSWFDGKDDIVGGNASQTIYPAYLVEYNANINDATPFDLTSTHTLVGNDLTIRYTATQAGAYSAGNLVAHVVVTESHIPDNWLAGLTEVNFTVRKMAPSATGTSFATTQGTSYTDSVTITLDPSWVKENMEVVVFIQNSSTKEIFNSARNPLMGSQFAVDPELGAILNEFPASSCAASVTPQVTIYNNGNTTITSLDINYDLNGTTGTYNWTGSLPYYTYATVTLPVINFTPQASNSLSINISNPNGGATDEGSTNNSDAKSWNGANQFPTGLYTMTLQLDRYGSETTWEFQDGSGNVLSSGGPYQDTPNGQPLPTPIIATQIYSAEECVTFVIKDSYGDGICCDYGAGSFTVVDQFSANVASGGQFTAEAATEWETKTALAIARDLTEAVRVYPNPSNGAFTIELGDMIQGEAEISLLGLDGKIVFRALTTDNFYKANVSDLASGVYMLKVRTENGQAVKKLTIE